MGGIWKRKYEKGEKEREGERWQRKEEYGRKEKREGGVNERESGRGDVVGEGKLNQISFNL